MAHERIRKFNTRDTYPNQTLDSDLCQVVKARGTLVFVRGQVGQDLLEHICRIQVYVTDRTCREPVYQVIGKWLKGVYPVSTGLIVQGLARPEWVMEIEATAVVPD